MQRLTNILSLAMKWMSDLVPKPFETGSILDEQTDMNWLG